MYKIRIIVSIIFLFGFSGDLKSNITDINFYDRNRTTGIVCDGNIIWQSTISCLIKRNVVHGQVQYYTYENSGLPARTINDLAIAPNGHLWLAGDSGLIEFDGHTFTRYDTSNSGLTGNLIFAVNCMPNGMVWCAALKQGSPSTMDLISYDGSSWNVYNSQNSIFSSSVTPSKIYVTVNNEVWVKHDKLYHINGTTWTAYDDSNTPLNVIKAVTVDNLGNFYAASNDMVYKFSSGAFTTFQSFNNLLAGEVMLIDNNLEIWICNNDFLDGATIEHIDNNGFQTTYNASNGISEHHMTVIKADNNNHIWIGTIGGLEKFDGQNFTHLYGNGLPPSAEVNDLQPEYQGKLWVGCGFSVDYNLGGLASYDGQQWNVFTKNNSALYADCVLEMAKDQSGYLWIVSRGNLSNEELFRYDGNNFTPITYPGSNTNTIMNGIEVDASNQLWILKDKLYKYDQSTWTVFDSTMINPGVPVFGYMSKIALDASGNLGWLATTMAGNQSFGLFKFDGTNWSYISCPFNGNIRDMTVDINNVLWIATSSGLLQYDGVSWNQFNMSNSPMVNDFVYAVSSDINGKIYFDNYLEVMSFDGTNWNIIENPNSDYHYSSNRILCDQYNNIYFCGYPQLWIHNEQGINNLVQVTGNGKVTGKVYYDVNQNGIYDQGEYGLPGHRILAEPDSLFSFSNSTGEYSANRNPGNYTIAYVQNTAWNLTSDSAIFHVTISDSAECCYNFGLYPVNPITELEIEITPSLIRCGLNFQLYLTYRNKGTSISSGRVMLLPDPIFSFILSNPAVDQLSGDTLIWNYIDLLPSEQRTIICTFSVPANNAGQMVTSVAWLEYIAGSVNYSADIEGMESVVLCSADPNDKLASPARGSQHYILSDDTLVYTIRFENVGNDTAFNIRIIDTLSSLLEHSSLEVVSSSHPVSTTMKPGGIVEFTFADILLPYVSLDSLNAHGFVKYRILQQNTLPLYSVITNEAAIYFDFNDPIYTNQTWQILTDSIHLGIGSGSKSTFVIYPNPFRNSFSVHHEDPGGKVEYFITDISGKLILRNTFSRTAEIDMTPFSNGFYFIHFRGKETVTKKLIKN